MLDKQEIISLSKKLPQAKSLELQSKRLIDKYKIQAPNDKALMKLIKNNNYHTVSEYIKAFDNKVFSHEKLAVIIDLDDKIRSILLDVIGTIEKKLKYALSYRFSINHEYGNIAYLDEDNFSNKNLFKKFYSICVNTLKREQRKENELEDNKFEYVPIWEMIDLLTFSECIIFLELVDNNTKKEVSQEFNVELNEFIEIINRIKHDRNNIAHFKKIFKEERSLKEILEDTRKIFNHKKKWNEDILNPIFDIVKEYIEYYGLNLEDKETLVKR